MVPLRFVKALIFDSFPLITLLDLKIPWNSEAHRADCERVSCLNLEDVLFSVVMGLGLNADSVALVPCVIRNENPLRMQDPPLRCGRRSVMF